MLLRRILCSISSPYAKNFGELRSPRSGFNTAQNLRDKTSAKAKIPKRKRDYVPPADRSKDEYKDETAAKKAAKNPQRRLNSLNSEVAKFKLPPLELLDPADGEQVKVDTETLQANSLS